jgi:hypothetical protein
LRYLLLSCTGAAVKRVNQERAAMSAGVHPNDTVAANLEIASLPNPLMAQLLELALHLGQPRLQRRAEEGEQLLPLGLMAEWKHCAAMGGRAHRIWSDGIASEARSLLQRVKPRSHLSPPELFTAAYACIQSDGEEKLYSTYSTHNHSSLKIRRSPVLALGEREMAGNTQLFCDYDRKDSRSVKAPMGTPFIYVFI